MTMGSSPRSSSLDTLTVVDPKTPDSTSPLTKREDLEDEGFANRTPAEIIAEFLPNVPKLLGSERKTTSWPEGRSPSR